MTPLCKSFFKNTTYNIQMRWRTLVSNCVTPLPPLENPGYTPEGVMGPLLSPLLPTPVALKSIITRFSTREVERTLKLTQYIRSQFNPFMLHLSS